MQLPFLAILSLPALSTLAGAAPYPIDAEAASHNVCMQSLTPQCCDIRKSNMDLFKCQGLPLSSKLSSRDHWVRHCKKRNQEATCCQQYYGTTICTKSFLRKHRQHEWKRDELETSHGNATETQDEKNDAPVAEGEKEEEEEPVCRGWWVDYVPSHVANWACGYHKNAAKAS